MDCHQKVTDPILELARISERMTHLDFDARYQGKSFNETAILGNHINQLADTLEATISELKTANNVLQKDIEKKMKWMRCVRNFFPTFLTN